MLEKGDFPMLEHAEDRILVARTIDGDVRAFETLMRRHGPFMRAYATRLLGSVGEADDVVQEAFITAWKRLDTLKDRDAARAWLIKVVSHKSVDAIRARRSRESSAGEELPLPSSQEPQRVAEVHSAIDALSATLNRLPDHQRQCWMLKEVGGYTYEEIADRLEMSHSAVRGTLARVRATILGEMEGWR